MVFRRGPETTVGYKGNGSYPINGFHEHGVIRLLVPNSIAEEQLVVRTEQPSKSDWRPSDVEVTYGYHPEIVLEYKLSKNINPKALLRILSAPSDLRETKLVAERRDLLGRLPEIDQELTGGNGLSDKPIGKIPDWIINYH